MHFIGLATINTYVDFNSWYAGKTKPLQLGDLYMQNESTDGAEIQPQEETNLLHSELTKLPQDEANPSQLEDKIVQSQDTSNAETEAIHEERNPPESSVLKVEAKQPKDGDKVWI